MPFKIGEYIGPYQLVAELGQGGMANVYKAYHDSLDRYVAIKVIHLAFSQDEGFLLRFQREARVIAKLDHPNIVPIYDFSQYENRPYIVMKLIEGESLRAKINRAPLTDCQILEILEAVGSALSYAHQQNVLHRDIKPGNVLIGQDNHIYLADFGLARLAYDGAISITGDQMIGTPQYMSPEQGLGKSGIDQRTDIYSLGIMLYEMVTGRLPFDAETPYTIIHDHIYTPPPPPHTFNKNISPQIETIIDKALAKEPDDRYPDASSLVDQFRSYVNQSSGLKTGTPSPISETIPAAPTIISVGPKNKPAGNQMERGKSSSNSAPRKPGKKNGVLILGIMIVVFGLITVLIIGAGLYLFSSSGGQNDQQNQLQTQIAEQVITLQVTASRQPQQGVATPGLQRTSNDTQQIVRLIDEAAVLWNDGKTEEAQKKIIEAQNLSGSDAIFNDLIINELGKQNAWGLAAFALFSGQRAQPLENLNKQVDKIHEVVYKAAIDERCENLFIQNASNPMFLAATIRWELYFGDKGKAKGLLDKTTNNPIQNKRFPELKLLSIEIDILENNGEPAKLHYRNLLQEKNNLPIWVLEEAKKLEPQINSQ